MKIKILYDKTAVDKALHTGWGVSVLVNENILFDTGEKGTPLIENMRGLGVDMHTIEKLVISHDHWDHTGGMRGILARKKGITVYACPCFSQEFKDTVQAGHAKLVEAKDFMKIGENIFITGEIPGAYHARYMGEQALVMKTEKGISVITGCAHPGIVKMVEAVRRRFPGEQLHLVFGGFHLKESDAAEIERVVDDFKKMAVQKAGPTHCSGDEAEAAFKKRYGENFVQIRVGQELDL